MKRELITFTGCLLSLTLWAPVYAAKGTYSASKCITGNEFDTMNSNASIRKFEFAFNQKKDADRGCKKTITLKHDIVLDHGLVFQGNSTGGLTIDGGGHELDASKLTEEDRCVIAIQGSASGVTITNLKITGDTTAPISGICLLTNDNRLQGVTVKKMGKAGIVVTGTGNVIERDPNKEGESSEIVDNKGPGIYMTKGYYDNVNTKVSIDTIVVRNAVTQGSATDTTDTTDEAEESAADISTEDQDGEAHLYTAEAVSVSGYDEGQQIYVVNDKTDYIFDAIPKKGTYTLKGDLVIQKNGDDGVPPSTVLLIFSAKPPTGSVTLLQSLLAVVTQLDDAELDSQYPMVTGPALSTKISGKMTKKGKFSNVKVSQSDIYMVAYPSPDAIVSSTAPILMGGEKAEYCWSDNAVDTSCTTSGPGGSGGGFGSDSDFDPFADEEGEEGEGTTSDKYAQPAAYDAKLIKWAREECQYDQEGNPQYDDYYDRDNDSLFDIIEDNVTADCTYTKGSKETDSLNYDTDGDGLGDGEEDSNQNGYVDCAVYAVTIDGKQGTKKYDLVPRLRGEDGDGNACFADEADCTAISELRKVPHPESLGLVASGENWLGVPKYKKSGDGFTAAVLAADEKVFCTETDPRVIDSDGDGLSDGQESRHRYVDLSKPARLYPVGSNSAISDQDCGPQLLTDESSGRAGRTFVALGAKSEDSEKLLQWYECRSESLWWASDYTGGVEPFTGETNPRLKDTDGDGLPDLDPNETCPNNPDPNCEAECAKGWRVWQIGQIAGFSDNSYGLDLASRQAAYSDALTQIVELTGKSDMASRQQLDSLVQKIGETQGHSDNDGIPDLVEAQNPQLFAQYDLDCTGTVLSYNTSPFKTWTDGTLESGAGTTETLPFNDSNDPCPGTPSKSGKSTPESDIEGCLVKRQYNKMRIFACYVDRDNDGLKDCEEDKDGDGELDDGETSPLKKSTNDTGVSDGIAVNLLALDKPLSNDDDGDGLPNDIEVLGGGATSAPTGESFYADVTLNVGTCRGVGSEDAWVKLPTDAPLRKKGFEFVFAFNTDPKNPDSDGDGLSDGDEVKFGYAPTNADSDDDGLCDGDVDVPGICVAGEDLNKDGKTPYCTDTNNDDICDDPATLSNGDPGESNPCDSNTDHHGKSDFSDECKNVPKDNCLKANAFGTDTDSDGIPDLTEIDTTKTNPFEDDTDGDGLIDGCLKDAQTGEPVLGKGELCNQMKGIQFFDNFDAFNSPDCGGSAVSYYECDTDPLSADTDNDGMSDKLERTYPLNPFVKDTDGDCIPDGLEDMHFTKNADGSYTPIADSIDGTFAGCTEQAGGIGGAVVRICTELNAAMWDTDGDGLGDGVTGGLGEDLNCNGVQDIQADTLLAVETSPLTWDTDADGYGDLAEMTAHGGFNAAGNLNRAVTGRSVGCSMLATAVPQEPRSHLLLVLMLGLPVAVLLRERKRSCRT